MTKPVAIITAFQGGTIRDATGRKITSAVARLVHNRKANRELAADLMKLDLGFLPVHGAGQEERRSFFGLVRYIVPSSEESYVVQPKFDMPEADFETVMHSLLRKYDQFVVAIKVPSTPQAFLLHRDGSREDMGSSAEPRTPLDRNYTQLKSGPRADPKMLSSWEMQGEQNRTKHAQAFRKLDWRAFLHE